MPRLIKAGFDSKLTTLSSNRAETAAFLNEKPKAYDLPNFCAPNGYQLVASSPKKSEEGETQIICLIYSDGSAPETVYKVKMITRNEPNAYLPVKNCTQLVVWRQVAGFHREILSGFARTVFNFLLRSHNIMISDEHQTDDGKRFWLDRMGESLMIADQGVYYIDLNNIDETMTPIVERIQTFDDLMSVYVPKGWGADEEHRNRAFLISTQYIKPD